MNRNEVAVNTENSRVRQVRARSLGANPSASLRAGFRIRTLFQVRHCLGLLKRFYDLNVWSARKQIEKLLYASQSGKTKTGQGTRPVGLEQLSFLSVGRSGASARS
jgi:hypothetical protein